MNFIPEKVPPRTYTDNLLHDKIDILNTTISDSKSESSASLYAQPQTINYLSKFFLIFIHSQEKNHRII